MRAALERGDPLALRTLELAGTRVGTVLAAVCNAIGPGVIVLGGELAEVGTPLLGPVELALHAHIMPISRPRVTLRPAALGEAGGALGGIALVLHASPAVPIPGPAGVRGEPMNRSWLPWP
ncbi:ROK family protein [Streptomyces sp. M19]